MKIFPLQRDCFAIFTKLIVPKQLFLKSLFVIILAALVLQENHASLGSKEIAKFQKRPDVHKIVLSIKSPPPQKKSVNFEDFILICTVFPRFGPFSGGVGGTKFWDKNFSEKSSCPYNSCPQFWGRKWLRQFYGRLEKCVLSAGKPMSIQFLVLGGGGYFWFWGGGVPILLWARGFF